MDGDYLGRKLEGAAGGKQSHRSSKEGKVVLQGAGET